LASAEVCPVGMFAPKELVATLPSTPTAAVASRVVVVLPLVPETRAMARPAARCASSSGSILRPIQPPMTEPSPRPAARDRAAAVRDTELATFARRGILASVTRARLLHPGAPQIAAGAERFGSLPDAVGWIGGGSGFDLCRTVGAFRGGVALHSAPPALTCGFGGVATAPRGRFWLRVEGSGVEWGPMVRPGGPTGPGVGGAANVA